jgi:hypothetical protein
LLAVGMLAANVVYVLGHDSPSGRGAEGPQLGWLIVGVLAFVFGGNPS